MKIKLSVIIAIFICWTGLGLAGPVGDIDADGQITITEAVGALQVTTGTRVPAYTNETDKIVYDPSEYQASQEIPYKTVWKQTTFGSGPRATGIGIIHIFQHDLNGQDVIAGEYTAGIYADYNLIDYSIDGKSLGWKWSNSYELFDPPLTNKIDSWPIGHTITNMSVMTHTVSGYPPNESYRYREYTLLGVEDVVVPAGRFSSCLKILQRRSINSLAIIYYRAKDVGTVKIQRANPGGSGQIWELMDIENKEGRSVYGNLSGLCMANGTWTTQSECVSYNPHCIESSKFTLVYDTSKALPTYLNLAGFPDAWGFRSPDSFGYKMTTTDGITFTPDPSVNWPDNNNDGQPDLPDITLAINGTALTGTLAHNNINFDLTGTVTCR